MQYRGFEVRENTKRGIWQAITPTALHWEDGLSAPDRFALKTAIDAHCEQQRPNPWSLPSKLDVAIDDLMIAITNAQASIAAR